MKTSEVLIKSKALITDPKNWIQGDFSRNEDGSYPWVPDFESEAVCFCTIGAIAQVTGLKGDIFSNRCEALHIVRDTLGHKLGNSNVGVAEYNDTRSHEDVLELFDLSIKASLEEESKNEQI